MAPKPQPPADVIQLVNEATLDVFAGVADVSKNMQIVDEINRKPVRCFDFLYVIETKLLQSKSATQAISALHLLETVVKNCPSSHPLIQTTAFMEMIVSTLPKKVKDPSSNSSFSFLPHFTSSTANVMQIERVDRTLLLIRAWGEVFHNSSCARVYQMLKEKQVTFPTQLQDETAPIITPAARRVSAAQSNTTQHQQQNSINYSSNSSMPITYSNDSHSNHNSNANGARSSGRNTPVSTVSNPRSQQQQPSTPQQQYQPPPPQRQQQQHTLPPHLPVFTDSTLSQRVDTAHILMEICVEIVLSSGQQQLSALNTSQELRHNETLIELATLMQSYLTELSAALQRDSGGDQQQQQQLMYEQLQANDVLTAILLWYNALCSEDAAVMAAAVQPYQLRDTSSSNSNRQQSYNSNEAQYNNSSVSDKDSKRSSHSNNSSDLNYNSNYVGKQQQPPGSSPRVHQDLDILTAATSNLSVSHSNSNINSNSNSSSSSAATPPSYRLQPPRSYVESKQQQQQQNNNSSRSIASNDSNNDPFSQIAQRASLNTNTSYSDSKSGSNPSSSNSGGQSNNTANNLNVFGTNINNSMNGGVVSATSNNSINSSSSSSNQTPGKSSKSGGNTLDSYY